MRTRLCVPMLALLSAGILGGSLPAIAHEDHDDPFFQYSSIDKRWQAPAVIPSRSVELTEAEQQAGVVNLETILPILDRINQAHPVFNAQQFNYFVRGFHYPYRNRFELSRQKPPTQVVLHWTANPRPQIPLFTFSAFLRSSSRGRIVERPNQSKNVSNYLLTGSLGHSEQDQAYLVKLTRGDLRSWGDIPRVTAYPTSDRHDDNKYDGRGAIGLEIESPDFGTFYRNPQQRQRLHDFLVLVLGERGVLDEFAKLRQSPHWEDMQALHQYLVNNVARIDVDARGGIAQNYQHLDRLLRFFPDLSPGVYREAQRMFQYVSGHGVVAREYNTRMIRSGRPRDARYDKIDFTEAHVFVVAMDLLLSDLSRNNATSPYAPETLRALEAAEHRQQRLEIRSDSELPPADPLYERHLPSGRVPVQEEAPF